MFLGIEIGGTKLQLGVGDGQTTELIDIVRAAVDLSAGAAGIRDVIAREGTNLVRQYCVTRVGVGFGGPVNAQTGCVICSHQIDGWVDFPLATWCQEQFGVPATIENDSNLAGLAEATIGAGRDARVVFYSNVGSGIGGALCIDGKIYAGGTGIAIAEIGHLRPGPDATEPQQTVESVASGWALADRARRRIEQHRAADAVAIARLTDRCDRNADGLTGKTVMDAAIAGNALASDIVSEAIRVYGWALAQVVTLVSPNVIVIGGGVAQAEETHFLEPLRRCVRQYVMPPLRDTYAIRAASLGRAVVVHGAIALAKTIAHQRPGGPTGSSW